MPAPDWELGWEARAFKRASLVLPPLSRQDRGPQLRTRHARMPPLSQLQSAVGHQMSRRHSMRDLGPWCPSKCVQCLGSRWAGAGPAQSPLARSPHSYHPPAPS